MQGTAITYMIEAIPYVDPEGVAPGGVWELTLFWTRSDEFSDERGKRVLQIYMGPSFEDAQTYADCYAWDTIEEIKFPEEGHMILEREIG